MLPYNEQGYIYFVCKTFGNQPKETQGRIKSLCEEIGGTEYSAALFAALTSPISIRAAAQKYYISESQLYKLRKRFYESFAKYARTQAHRAER